MKIKYFIAATLAAVTFSSCSDMFDDGSNRYVYNPELNEKVDSMFYINGILKGVQQAIDQNVIINEVRGDLLAATSDATTDLQRMAKFDYANGNKYDSAYVYYRIINNCNYYVAHRDTTLATGSSLVAMKEYAEAKAIRAWAYMQLARNYGSVPFYTTPLTNISDIEAANNLEKKDMAGICQELAPDLEQYINLPVPNWGDFDAGINDNGSTKTVQTAKMMFPVELVLADLYLETNQYENAAKHYFNYLKKNQLTCDQYYSSYFNYPEMSNLPGSLLSGDASYYSYPYGSWNMLFMSDSETQTYVAMASNKLRGQTTELPGFFGYNYYTSADGKSYSNTPALTPSQAYLDLSNSQEYYYRVGKTEKDAVYASASLGDMRYHSSYTTYRESSQDEPVKIINKYRNANIQVYRTVGIYLKLAEAINRMGYPDVAFAVLKDGWNSTLEENTTYMTEEDINFLKTTIPFLTAENKVVFNDEEISTNSQYGYRYSTGNQAIHSRGAGYTMGNGSKYQLDTELEKKFKELQNKGYQIPATPEDTLKAKINCVEDLLCDEMALEQAFEGSRFGDLCRIARHKNSNSEYKIATWGDNFGSIWLRDKLAFKNPVVDLSNPENWFMPFK